MLHSLSCSGFCSRPDAIKIAVGAQQELGIVHDWSSIEGAGIRLEHVVCQLPQFRVSFDDEDALAAADTVNLAVRALIRSAIVLASMSDNDWSDVARIGEVLPYGDKVQQVLFFLHAFQFSDKPAETETY